MFFSLTLHISLWKKALVKLYSFSILSIFIEKRSVGFVVWRRFHVEHLLSKEPVRNLCSRVQSSSQHTSTPFGTAGGDGTPCHDETPHLLGLTFHVPCYVSSSSSSSSSSTPWSLFFHVLYFTWVASDPLQQLFSGTLFSPQNTIPAHRLTQLQTSDYSQTKCFTFIVLSKSFFK